MLVDWLGSRLSVVEIFEIVYSLPHQQWKVAPVDGLCWSFAQLESDI